MADELEGELAPEADAPGQFVAKRRRRHPIWDVGVLVLAIACVVSAIVVVEQIRGSRVNAPDQSAVASDGFTPIKLGVTISGRSGIGDNAPTFRLNNPEGTLVSLSELRGKPVVLNFWATWCVPCRQELPTLDTYYRAREKAGLRVFAVTTEDSVPLYELKKLFAVMHIPAVRKIKGPYDILTGVPTNYIIDRSGHVRYAKAGAFDLDALNETLIPLLNEPAPPETPATPAT